MNIDEIRKKYPHDVSMYKIRSGDVITLDKLEKLLRDRFYLLMNIEATNDKGITPLTKEWQNHLQELLIRDNLHDYERLLFSPGHELTPEDISRRRMDYLAHYFMSLAYCKTRDKRVWFLNLEIDVFQLKFSNLNDSSQREFLKLNMSEFPYELLSNEEKLAIKHDLMTVSDKTWDVIEATDYLKVPFQKAPDAISEFMLTRKKIVYVPHNELHYLAARKFRRNLTIQLVTFYKAYKSVVTGTKLEPIFDCLPISNSDEFKHGLGKNPITLSSLPNLVQKSFPLCTRNLYEALNENHHLKYTGRTNLQRYLKGIGLPMKHCMELFRSAFMKEMDEATFNKNYAYHVRHNYGLEGSRINFIPPSCEIIMDLPVKTGDQHGCPFKSWDPDKIKSKLEANCLSREGIKEVMDNVKEGHCKMACSKYFEYTHNGTPIGVNHPNQYFEESLKYYESLKLYQVSVPSTSKEEEHVPSTSKEEEPIESLCSYSEKINLDW